jgi:hypothetical protein
MCFAWVAQATRSDPPVPLGDSPDGTATDPEWNKVVSLLERPPIRLGESPSGPGGSPGLPTLSEYDEITSGNGFAEKNAARPQAELGWRYRGENARRRTEFSRRLDMLPHGRPSILAPTPSLREHGHRS